MVTHIQVCSQLLLTQQLIREYSELLDRPRPDISVFVKEALYKKIVTKCKKTNSCPHCRSTTGQFCSVLDTVQKFNDIWN